eukprot:gene32646-39470_t
MSKIESADFYDVETLRVACKGADKVRISYYEHLLNYEDRSFLLQNATKYYRVVSFARVTTKDDRLNPDGEESKGDDFVIKNDVVNLKNYPIAWVLNDQVPQCMRCHASFGAQTWRHHCRLCGFLVCNLCSRHNVQIYIKVTPSENTSTNSLKGIKDGKRLLESPHSRVCMYCFTHQVPTNPYLPSTPPPSPLPAPNPNEKQIPDLSYNQSPMVFNDPNPMPRTLASTQQTNTLPTTTYNTGVAKPSATTQAQASGPARTSASAPAPRIHSVVEADGTQVVFNSPQADPSVPFPTNSSLPLHKAPNASAHVPDNKPRTLVPPAQPNPAPAPLQPVEVDPVTKLRMQGKFEEAKRLEEENQQERLRQIKDQRGEVK